MIVMFRILFGLSVTLIAAAAIAQPLADKELLSVPTRFGTLTVTVNDESNVVAHLGDQALEVGANTDFSASLDGLFQVPEGDLVVLDIPSGARGMPSAKAAILVTGPKSFAVVSDNEFYSANDTFKVEKNFDKIVFDLGWENRKRKFATYSNGKIIVSNKPGEPNARVSRDDCAEILNLVERCRKFRNCELDSMSPEIGGMAAHYWLNSLEEGPVFRTDHFLTACKATCRTKRFSAKEVRNLLCGY